MTFPSINAALDRALAARNYVTPTAVQLAVLDEGARHRDLLVSAQTGSGKTVAFGLAMAPTLLGEAERLEPAAEPLALIIAPTRELAMQVQRELVWLYAETGARIVTCVGGMDPRAEARQLGFGAHIVVGTPGRLRDHIERGRLDLSRLKAIVLDEADEMLDLGFREDLEFILDKTPAERQTLLFSATMPRDIAAMATRYQRDAVRIETIRRDEQHADIEYRAVKVVPSDVENAVVNVLRFYEPRAALVFCSTRDSVKRMHARLVERGFAAVALSGELNQNERTQALVAVRDGRARVLVATDVAARGLDLPDLALVVHGELPHDRETLLHRSGRTGRAGKKGMCVLVVPYNRRRKAEALLGAARLAVTWAPPPSADEIRVRDQERFLADAIFTDAATEPELALAKILQAGRTPDDIALALVRLHRARLPEPEELTEDTGPPRRDGRWRREDRDDRVKRPRGEGYRARGEGPRFRDDGKRFGEGAQEPRKDRPWERREHGDGQTAVAAPAAHGGAHAVPAGDADGAGTGAFEPRASRPPRHANDTRRREGRDMVWFRLNIGRERNADPRWILPLICKAGGISKTEIGAIKISDRETRFEIAADHADQFAHAARTNKNKEGHITRVGSYSSGDDAAVSAAIDTLSRSAGAPGESSRDEQRPKKAPWQHRETAKSGSRSGPGGFAGKKNAKRDRGPGHGGGPADRKGGYADRKGGYADRKGGHADRQGGHAERHAADRQGVDRKGPDAKPKRKHKHRVA